jgi:hypothetical protein
VLNAVRLLWVGGRDIVLKRVTWKKGKGVCEPPSTRSRHGQENHSAKWK